jgi:hypothetical protein
VTPPPSEPIRPVGPLDGGTYVDRLGRSSRVARRGPRDQDDDAEHDGHHDPRHPAHEQQRPATPIRDPRAYDDHGRAPDDDDEPDHPHVDATA